MKEGRKIVPHRKAERRRGEERRAERSCSCSPTEKTRNIPLGNFEMVKKKDNPPPLPRWDDRVHDP